MAASSSIYFPVDIYPFLPLWWTKVQVIRMWEVPIYGQFSGSISVEVVFMDVQGSKIQGSISKQVLRMRKVVLEEEHSYEISGVVVIPNEGQDRPTNHPFRLLLDMSSKVILHEHHPLISLGLSPLATIDVTRIKTERPYETRFPVDKVGLLTLVSSERHYLKDNKQVNVVFIKITDPTGRTECVLHGTYVDQLDEYLKKNGPLTPIIVVQFARVSTTTEVLFGDAGIESVEPVTKLLFNPIIPVVFDMRKWLVINNYKLDSKLKYKEIHAPYQPLSDEFLLSHPKRAIVDLNVANDKCVKMTSGGTYPVCTILRPILAVILMAVRPTALQSQVFDGKDLAYLKIHHQDVEDLLQVSCEELVQSILEPDYFPYPSVFNTLVGQTMLFLVHKKAHLDAVHDGGFNVIKVCTDPEIVRMFRKDEFYVEGPASTNRITPWFNPQGDTNEFTTSAGGSRPNQSRLNTFTDDTFHMDHASTSNNIPFRYFSPGDYSDMENESFVDKHCMSYLDLSP
ncbi:Nucleic acid-binding, OB-fold [Sesbania bispinosa]|nr:Nucleic acid-binding, OB-fold [Sesbania bispinosa]